MFVVFKYVNFNKNHRTYKGKHVSQCDKPIQRRVSIMGNKTSVVRAVTAMPPRTSLLPSLCGCSVTLIFTAATRRHLDLYTCDQLAYVNSLLEIKSTLPLTLKDRFEYIKQRHYFSDFLLSFLRKIWQFSSNCGNFCDCGGFSMPDVSIASKFLFYLHNRIALHICSKVSANHLNEKSKPDSITNTYELPTSNGSSRRGMIGKPHVHYRLFAYGKT